MTKLSAVAAFFAAAVLSGCQSSYYANCPIEEPYYSGYSGGAWAETYPAYPSDNVYVDDSSVYTDTDGSVYVDSSADDVYVDDNSVYTDTDDSVYTDYTDTSYIDDSYGYYNDYYIDDSYSVTNGYDGYIDDGYIYDDSTGYDDSQVEEYYPSNSSYYYPSSSSYYFPSSTSSTYYSPWYARPRFQSSLSYPSYSWRNRFIGQQPSTMYYYPDNSISMPSWQSVYPYYY